MTVDLDKGDTRLIIETCKAEGVLRNQAAYILATADHETAYKMKPVTEAFWLSENWRRRNLRYYPWHGRGYVQLTWKRNYEHAQEQLGLGTQLTDDPDLVKKPEIAARILVRGSMEGWFTGKALPAYIDLKRSDFYHARRVINGMDRASTIAALAKEYDAALLAEGYGVEEEPEATEPEEPDQPTIDTADDIQDMADRLRALEECVRTLEAQVKTLQIGTV